MKRRYLQIFAPAMLPHMTSTVSQGMLRCSCTCISNQGNYFLQSQYSDFADTPVAPMQVFITATKGRKLPRFTPANLWRSGLLNLVGHPH